MPKRVGVALDGHRPRARAQVVMVSIAIALAVFALPAFVLLLNAVRIGGFPLGYYWAAQGAIILLCAIGFASVGRPDNDGAATADDPRS